MLNFRGYKTQFRLILIFSLACSLCFVFITSSNPIFNELFVPKTIKDKPNCSTLYSSDADYGTVRYAEQWSYPKNETFTDKQLKNEIKKDCNHFLKQNKYFLTTNDDEERQFSIAFSLVVFTSAMQVERLLRAVYRPWNYYCIHVDANVDSDFYDAIEQLVQCLKDSFGNIVNTKKQVNVRWGKMSVLTADLNCMRELYERFKAWKYLINLTGQEFPLKTNRELVHILKAFNGANNVEGTYTRRNEERIPILKMPFPLVWYKGAVHITVNRDFIKFIVESPKAEIILSALELYEFADEQFFSTINYNPQLRIPGSFVGDPDENTSSIQPNLYFITRLKNWGDYPCLSQKIVRNICIWGVSDLPKLIEAKHLFANKFYENFQPATLRCLEEWYYNKVRVESATGSINVDIPFYKSLAFVVNQFQTCKFQL